MGDNNTIHNAQSENKLRYEAFCAQTYVPVFSQPWWMDAICGAENWDVWLYEKGGNVLAAMPYYMENRGSWRYITKAPLTQNNGIIFKEDPRSKPVTEAENQEKVICAACEFIENMGIDVYEQQYHHSFRNWQPFFWNQYTAMPRYTYVIQDPSDLEQVNANLSSSYRNVIRKGQRLTTPQTDIGADAFFELHKKIFEKQGLENPFTKELWSRLNDACAQHDAGQMYCAKDEEGNIHAIMFLVWDQRAAYLLLGGAMPEHSGSQAYPALVYHAITEAGKKGLAFDFEGSMIRRIAKSFRQFGGVPVPYFRIRKVFNPEIIRKEAEDHIRRMKKDATDKENSNHER